MMRLPGLGVTTRGSCARTAVVTLCVLTGAAAASAHDTTHKVAVPVQVKQVQGRSGVYQMAFGCLPRDAVSGELVVCGIKNPAAQLRRRRHG